MAGLAVKPPATAPTTISPYETSSAAAALQNDFKKRYKRAAKGLAAAVAKNGCFALQGKPFDSDKQRCCSGAENSRITICAAKWLRKDKECCYR